MSQKGQTGILILVGILIIAAVAGGAYYFGVHRTPAPVSSPTPVVTSQTPQPISSPTDETANWKTYTNNSLGFSIKYPTNFDINNSASKSLGSEVTFSQIDQSSNLHFVHISIYLKNIPKNLSLQQAIDRIDSPHYSPEVYKDIKLGQTKIKIGGIDGMGREVPAEFYGYDAYVLKGDKLYIFGLQSFPESSAKSDQNIFNQILSTFKFLP